jgi:hypothetical protein
MYLQDNKNVKVTSSDPTVNYDSAHGYFVGQFVFNQATPALFQAKSVSLGSAVWVQIWPPLYEDSDSIVLYIQSRGMNLFTNGYGHLGCDFNMPGTTFVTDEVYSGLGSFRVTGGPYVSIESTEFMAVDPSAYLRGRIWVKSTVLGTNNRVFAGLRPYDIDRYEINPWNYLKYTGSTDSELYSQLNSGDTTVKVVNASGWDNLGDYNCQFAWYNYRNSGGYQYPAYTYTRLTTPDYFPSNGGMWAAGGIVNSGSYYTITLKSPWAGPTLDAGTKVRNCIYGGSALFFMGIVYIPQEWTKIEGVIGGVITDGLTNNNKYPPGTACIRFIGFFNCSDGAGPYTNVSNISAIWFSELTEENL